jgi:class 3 adenylate cyclase
MAAIGAISADACLDGILVGIIIGLGLYNVALFAFIRERGYLYFALYSLCAGLYILSVSERLRYLLWPSFPRWDSIFSWFLVLLTMVLFVRFTQVFLNTAENLPWGHRLLSGLAVFLCAGPLLGAPLVGLEWRQAGMTWNTVLALTIFVSVVVLGWIFWRRGFAPARAYLAGNSFFCFGTCLYGLGILGLVPALSWLRTLAMMGIVFQAVFFSLGIADRMARLRRRLAEEELERVRFEQHLVAEKNKELAQRVEASTAALRQEKEETERLLYNILPRPVASELRNFGRTTPRRHDDVSILFADLEDFTVTVATIPPRKLVDELNTIFSAFDDIVERHGLEKIKTIGDCHLAVAGLPHPKPDHALACVQCALDMTAFIEHRNTDSPFKWRIRIGVHTGVVVAGVVGKRKFTYDIWGDAVNIAARVQNAAEPGRVNLSAYTYDLVRRDFEGEYRGKIQIKGKGRIDMYHVLKPKSAGAQKGNTAPQGEA